jgi:hypothetical protein
MVYMEEEFASFPFIDLPNFLFKEQKIFLIFFFTALEGRWLYSFHRVLY